MFPLYAKCFHAVQYFKGVDFFPWQLLTQGQLGQDRRRSFPVPYCEDKSYLRKMYDVCLNGNYGYCKFGEKKCDKIHFTDVCEQTENCKENFCDKKHPVRCFFFEKFRICKFGTFCSYSHIESAEEKFKSEFEKLKKKVLSLQIRNRELQTKLKNRNSQTTNISNETPKIKEIIHDNNSNIDMSLETLLKNNS